MIKIAEVVYIYAVIPGPLVPFLTENSLK